MSVCFWITSRRNKLMTHKEEKRNLSKLRCIFDQHICRNMNLRIDTVQSSIGLLENLKYSLISLFTETVYLLDVWRFTFIRRILHQVLEWLHKIDFAALFQRNNQEIHIRMISD